MIVKKNKKKSNKKRQIENDQMWKKIFFFENFFNKTKWKFCRKYDWTFVKKNVFSKNVIFDNRLMHLMLIFFMTKTKIIKRFFVNVNFKCNIQLKNINMSTKSKYDAVNHYIFIKKYIMYDNEKTRFDINQRNLNIKLKNEFSKKSVCFKSIKQKIIENYDMNRHIMKNNFEKKNRKKIAISSDLRRKRQKKPLVSIHHNQTIRQRQTTFSKKVRHSKKQFSRHSSLLTTNDIMKTTIKCSTHMLKTEFAFDSKTMKIFWKSIIWTNDYKKLKKNAKTRSNFSQHWKNFN